VSNYSEHTAFSGRFASGNNGGGSSCKNDPSCADQAGRGPIPPGLWVWDGGYTKKPNGRSLNPLRGTETFGRTLIRSHSCDDPFGPSKGPKFCSEGCVTGTVPTTKALNRLLDAEPNSILLVIP
jgi:hypothetical protein